MPLTGDAKRIYQLEWIKGRRDAWIHQNGPCAQCGSRNRLEVDHVDPATKLLNPRSLWSLSAAKRTAELSKCQVLCYCCHQQKTREQHAYIPPHGTRARYSRKDEHKCRCADCRRASTEYERARRARVKRSTLTPPR